MASIAGQLILALVADWLCHKIDPRWQERREIRRAHVRVLQSRRVAEAQRNVAQAMRNLAEAARNTAVEKIKIRL